MHEVAQLNPDSGVTMHNVGLSQQGPTAMSTLTSLQNTFQADLPLPHAKAIRHSLAHVTRPSVK